MANYEYSRVVNFSKKRKSFFNTFFPPFCIYALVVGTSVVVTMHSHFAFRCIFHRYIFFFLLIENQYPSPEILFDFWLSIDCVYAPDRNHATKKIASTKRGIKMKNK